MFHRMFRLLRFGAGLTLLALVGLLVAGCGSAQQGSQEKEKSAPPVAGTFVGEALPADAFIALVADLPEGEGDEREVSVYLCDGQAVSDWFWGTVDGNDLDLSSESGAQLVGQLTPDAVTGTITDPNGDAISFEAAPATGIAGLFNVNVAPDGSLSGASELGAQMAGQLGDRLEDNDSYPVSGTITPPDGQPEEFKAITSPNTADQHRWIVLEDGRIKGGNFGSHFEFDGFIVEQRFDCDFNSFDNFDFNHCNNFDFNRFVFVDNFDDFDFDDRDFDDFDHDFDFDRDQAGGTFGQVGGGGQRVGGQNGDGNKGGGQGGGGQDGGNKGGGGQDGGQGGGGNKGGGGKN